MKYYSEITKQFYNSEEECQKVEKAYAGRAAAVKDAYEAMIKAQDAYQKVLADYVHKYGNYDIIDDVISDFIKELRNI